MEKKWLSLYQAVEKRLRVKFSQNRAAWDEFSLSLEAEFPFLADLLFQLYGEKPEFAFFIEHLVETSFQFWRKRSARLKKFDIENPTESLWFQDSKQIAAMAYVDLWGGDFEGIIQRIPYLTELGITYLHLMPFYLSPENESDGGYAVSDYQRTDPRLGTMADLERLAEALFDAGIVLVSDFVFNHTSNRHEWAERAREGQQKYQNFYLIYENILETQVYQKHLRDIFPEVRRGSFSWDSKMERWVWTTFNSFQWDLNYANPDVFEAMAGEMLSLANRGIGILRLDAVAFIWKEAGTPCENLPKAHTLIRAFQSLSRIVCPSLLFKSEAIVHPDEIVKYVDARECQLSYNPLLMAELWEAAATKETRLLVYSLEKRHSLPDDCSWVNYLRCHDDIGWNFADEDAAALGINGYDHRRFLNDFYLGRFPGSFSRGSGFQYNPDTGDQRICGTAASLAGIEQARLDAEDIGGVGERGTEALERAVRRLLLLYGIVFSAGGIPLIYLGDELAVENNYDFKTDPSKSGDARWVHRPLWNQEAWERRNDNTSVGGVVYRAFCRFIEIRKASPIFSLQSLRVLYGAGPSILAFLKKSSTESLLVLGNFSESSVSISAEIFGRFTEGKGGLSLIDGVDCPPDNDLILESCGLRWIRIGGELSNQ